MNRRIGYIYLLVGPQAGVEQKIRDQSVALDRLGYDDLNLVVIAPHKVEAGSGSNLVLRPRHSLTAELDYGFRRFKMIEEAVDSRHYDMLLVRYPFADPFAPRLADRYPVVSEHHTLEVGERRALLRSGLSPLQSIHKRISLRREVTHGPAYLRKCRGVVGVTHEITRAQVERAGDSISDLTLPNGILVDRVPHTRFTPFDGQHLRLVFMASRVSPWHGADRLIRSLSQYRGRTRISLSFVGDTTRRRGLPSPPAKVEIVDCGRLQGETLDDVMAASNLSFSSLGLFRNGLSEGCTLKSRELVARGIPFVLGAPDPDISEVERLPWVLQVPNDESLLDIDALFTMAERMSALEAQEDVSGQMRSFAEQNLDWVAKLERLRSFLRRC